jgi:hypothetical protein
MNTRQATRKSSSTRRWFTWHHTLLLLSVVALVLSNRERILEQVRHFNKRYLNPLMLKMAGHRHSYCAAIQHVGRRSGQQYTTPIVADFSPERKALLIPLPYGVATDWCRNVVAAGRCTIKKDDVLYAGVEPEIVDAAVALPQLPAVARFLFRVFGIAKFLTVRIEGHIEAEQPHELVSAAEAGSLAGRSA